MTIRAKAAIYRGEQDFSIEEIEIRDLCAGEVLVKMMAAGVCGSDRHVLDNDWQVPTPLIGGHEGAGIVAAVGEGVAHVKPGDHVVISWYYPCTTCTACKTGKPWVCQKSLSNECLLPNRQLPATKGAEKFHSYLAAGTLSEYAIVTASSAVPISKNVPFEVAALIGCSIATGYGAVVNDAGVKPGDSVVIIGAGGVGLSIIMSASLAGAARIIAIDISDETLKLAKDFGATHTINSQEAAAESVREVVAEGADFVFEAIGRPETIELMPPLLRLGGSAILVGLPPQNSHVKIDALQLAEAGQRIIGSNYGSTVAERDFKSLAELYLLEKLPIDKLITNRVPLDKVNDAFNTMRRGAKGRTVVVMGQ